MKSFFIVKNDIARTIDEKYLVQTQEQKEFILNQINLNGLDLNEYSFYNELDKKNKFIDLYHNAIFETYFPREKKDNIYVYYPEPKIIETSDSTIYVNRWELIDASKINISSMFYICDDSEPEEHQRVLFIFKTPTQ